MQSMLSTLWHALAGFVHWTILGLALIRSGVVHVATPILRWIAAAARTAAVAFLPAVIGLAAAFLLFARVPPGTIGVRQANFGAAGIVPVDETSGLVFSPRVVESWHHVERTTQLLSFGADFVAGARPPLDVRTQDGNLASVCASVAYRVRAGAGHRVVADGLKQGYRERVRATSERILLQELSKLSSAQCSDVVARSACVKAALDELDGALSAVHVEALDIWIDSVAFGAEYEKKLQKKQLTRQTLLLQQADAAVELEKQRVGVYEKEIELAEKQIAARYDQAIEERAAAGRREIAEVRTAAQFEDKTTRAAAQSEYDRASALGERAVARTELEKRDRERRILREHGGRIWLARRAAQNLRVKQAAWDTRSTQVPPLFDLDAWVRLLAGSPP
ncbi:MAG: SPFH domain-containing protein [Planctomycetota bacterium]